MRWIALLWLIAVGAVPSAVYAHDDPVVTVRVLCSGFNALDLDAVLGEISDSAMLSVDGPVRGPDQIEQWVKQQMDNDLRIEIVDIGTPAEVPDGYTLAWTARFSRQDWRSAGIQSREVSNQIVIHNGRITQWTADFDASVKAETPASAAVATRVMDDSSSAMPEVFGVPASLIAGAVVAVTGAGLLLRSVVRK